LNIQLTRPVNLTFKRCLLFCKEPQISSQHFPAVAGGVMLNHGYIDE